MKLKIEEILWEITPKCNRNCSFCGSKDIINKHDTLDHNDLVYIAHQIGENADKVTISGGEPFILPNEELQAITSVLRDGHGCHVSVVTNGDMLSARSYDLFDLIGVSVNDANDAYKIIERLAEVGADNWKKTVFITNVNKINSFDIDAITNAASIYEIGIQFQLTMYHGEDAAMLNGEDIEKIRQQIMLQCAKDNVSFIFADNMQYSHTCTAGTRSLGILFNGDVVPCLSERSWTEPRKQGNVFDSSLEDIWQNSFKECRFAEDYKCCRDCFKYPDTRPDILKPVEGKEEDNTPYIPPIEPASPVEPIMVLYGVFPPNDVMMYGVQYPDSSGNPPFDWRSGTVSERKVYGVNDPRSSSDSE